MAGSVNDFIASVNKDLARPARFDITIPVPLKLVQYLNISKQLSLRCEAAQLPSISLGTIDRKIYGPIEKQPYMTSFNDAMFVINVSDDMSEKYLFDAWIQLINPNDTYNQTYKSDYAVPVSINQYDLSGNVSYSVTLNDAFPISVNQLDLDWSNETMFHKMYVDFAFHNWTQNGIQSVKNQVIGAAVGTAVDVTTSAISALSSGKKLSSIFGAQNSSQDATYSMKTIASKIDNL